MRRRGMLAGVVAVLGVEYLLRDGLVPALPTESTIRVAIGIEWALLAALLLFWVTRVERSSWATIGIGRWRSRHLWLGAIWFLAATAASAVVGVGLNAAGLDSLADMQPRLAGYAWPTLLALADLSNGSGPGASLPKPVQWLLGSLPWGGAGSIGSCCRDLRQQRRR